MPMRIGKLTKTMGARPMAEQPHSAGVNLGALSRADVVTIVRRLGYVAMTVFNTIQGNLVSSGRHQYAEALNDSLKPLVDCLVHFELEDDQVDDADTETDHEIP